MKVLHLGSLASVPSTLIKYQRRLGIKADLMLRSGHTSFDSHKVINDSIVISGGVKKFLLKVLLLVPRYDIIHSHILPFTSKYVKRPYFWKSMVFHYHGSNIRNQWVEKREEWSRGDFIGLSTPDLLVGAPDRAVYIPNPIDTQLFTRKKDFRKGSALWIMHMEGHQKNEKNAYKLAKEYNLDLTVLNRLTDAIPYLEFPRYLEQFEYFLDLKLVDFMNKKRVLTITNEVQTSFSLTGHQALSLGVKVIHNGEIHTEFPQEHDPVIIAKKWIEIYEELLKK